MRTITYEEWKTEGARRFGEDAMSWRFACPACGHVACVGDWKQAGAPESAVAYSCVGRWTGAADDKTFGKTGGPCQYAGGGLFRLNPVKVTTSDGNEHAVFEFAD